jgi:hypothetical protein
MAVRVEQRGNRRHRWLENEAKCHRAARASKDVLPDTLEFLCRNAVPNRPAMIKPTSSTTVKRASRT